MQTTLSEARILSGTGGSGVFDMPLQPISGLHDTVISGPNGEKVTLTWNPGAERRINNVLKEKQKTIDSEVLRLCAPMVPFKSGALERSGTIHTVIGSGEVVYATPYARYQYYATAQTRSYDPRRGARWFERMKTAHKDQILRLINS